MEVSSMAGGATLDDAGIATLAAQLRGPLLRPADPGYAAARSVWNAMVDRRPALIAQCRGAADVIAAVRFARARGLEISVRGGGHNVAGLAVTDGGLMIDLSGLNAVYCDPITRRVRVGPGATWGDVDHETQAFGLAVPGGVVSTTGVAGFTLGGGFGWLSRSYGLACDNLVSAQVVTADGRCLRASADQHADLFWGLRGGSGNFGVVTSFEFDAHPHGPEVLAGMVFHPCARAPEVFAAFRAITAPASDSLAAVFGLRRAPVAPHVPPAWHGELVAGIAVCWVGAADGPDGEAGRRAIMPVRALGEPAFGSIGPRPFTAHQTILDAGQPPGRRYYWKTHYHDAASDGLGQALIEGAGRIVSPHCAVLMMNLGGAISRVGEGATAFDNRSADYILNIQASWEDPSHDAVNIDWARAAWSAAGEHATGDMYANFMTDDDVADRLGCAYASATRTRLARVKREYDPDNVFHLNHNIAP